MTSRNDFTPIPYDPNFLGEEVPFPTFDSDDTLKGKVFKNSNSDFTSKFDETGQWRGYIHYSIATNTERRQPICAASNIKQDESKAKSKSAWSKDPAIGEENQLNEFYYATKFGDSDGIWDRGHVAQRAAIAWGEDPEEASKRTYYYTNCYPQHKKFNNDEWVQVERYVTELEMDKNGLISVFTGPIYDHPNPSNEGPLVAKDKDGNKIGKPVEIADAFFKIIVFTSKENKLAVRAFISLHNEEAVKKFKPDSDQPMKLIHTLEMEDDLLDDKGNKKYVSYAVSTKEIEFYTGLKFDQKLHDSNPKKDLVDNQKRSEKVITDASPEKIVISQALINPSGRNEKGREWVELKNVGKGSVDLAGWKLSDQNRREKPITLSGVLAPNATQKIGKLSDESGKVILTNNGGALFLEDSNGKLNHTVKWDKRPRDDEVIEFV